MALDPHEIRIDTSAPARRPAPPAPGGAQPSAIVGVVGLVLSAVAMGAWMNIGPQIMAGGAAGEMEEQYQILVDSKASDMDLGVRAGAVADLYLHAHDRTRYAKWKAIADQHMRRAGIPMP
jgi:hypothetical protein